MYVLFGLWWRSTHTRFVSWVSLERPQAAGAGCLYFVDNLLQAALRRFQWLGVFLHHLLRVTIHRLLWRRGGRHLAGLAQSSSPWRCGCCLGCNRFASF